MRWRPVSLKASQESIVPKTRVPRPLDVLKQPLDLGTGEVGVDDQSGPLADQVLTTLLPELIAALGGAPVLPDEGAVDRLAGARVPGEDGLTLVGDPDRAQLRPLDSGVGDRGSCHPAGHLPDLRGIVLDPARTGEVLFELRVAAAGDPTLEVEDEAGRAGGALVDGEDHEFRDRRAEVLPLAGYLRSPRGAPLPDCSSRCRFNGSGASLLGGLESDGRSPDGVN